MTRRDSLRGRLAGIVAAATALALLLFAGATYALVRFELERDQDVSLGREVTRISRLVYNENDYVGAGSQSCTYAVEPACSTVVGADAHPESSPLAVSPIPRQVAAGSRGKTYFTVKNPAGNIRAVAIPIQGSRALVVGVPTSLTDRAIARLGGVMLAVGAAGLAISALVGFVTAHLGLRPVRRLSQAMEHVRETGLTSIPEPRGGDDEIGRLEHSFTALLQWLERSRSAQRLLIADASHELRTPLTTVRTNVALLTGGHDIDHDRRRALAEDATREIERMSTLIDDLVDLARDGDCPATVEIVHLVEPVHAAITIARRHWPHVEYRVVGDEGLTLRGERNRLERLVSVLLDNAGKFTPLESDEVVEISYRVCGPQLELSVADRGIGIPKTDLPRVTDRFYRGQSAHTTTGSGLGLAIAHQIVEQHNGTMSIRNRTHGGTRITINIPILVSALFEK